MDSLGLTREEIRGALDPPVTFLSYFGTIWAAWWAGRCCQVGFCDCRCTGERAEMVPGEVEEDRFRRLPKGKSKRSRRGQIQAREVA